MSAAAPAPADIRARRERILRNFFGPGNLFRWSDGAPLGTPSYSTVPERMRAWVQEYLADGGVALLPRRRAAGQPLEWYAIADTDREYRALRDDLLAFIGPTYSDFNGAPYRSDPDDPIDSAAASFSGGRLYHLQLASASSEARVWRLLEVMRMLWKLRPRREVQAAQPVGRLLRNFEMALQVQDWAAADEAIELLRRGGRLGSQNLSHIKVRRLAVTAQWAAILALPEFDALLSARRPAAVTSAILRAVYEIHLAQYESAGDPAGAVARFREQVRDRFAPLLLSIGPLSEPYVLKLFMMTAVSTDNAQRRDTILNLSPVEGPARAYLESLAALVAPPRHPQPALVEPSIAAQGAFDSGDFDSAFGLLRRCPRDVVVVQRMLQCALEIGTLAAAATSIDAFKTLNNTDRERVLRPRLCRLAWEELNRLGGDGSGAAAVETATVAPPTAATGLTEQCVAPPRLPQNWTDWIERLNSDGAWHGAIETARHGAREWRTTEFLDDAALIDRFVAGLGAARDERLTTTLRNAVPYLLESFRTDQRAIPQLKPVYWSLFEILAFDAEIGTSDLLAVADLIGVLLDVGLRAGTDGTARNEYQYLVDLVRVTWSSVAAPRHVAWMIDVLAALADAAVQDRATFDPLLPEFLADCKRYHRRVTAAQWDVLASLCEEFGCADTYAESRPPRAATGTAAAAAEAAFDHALDGKTISIYTLSPQIASRARQVLERRFPHATFRVSADPDGSPRLRQWARESHIFVINTWDALHAATTFIRNNRPEHLPTLLPPRKTWSALVSVVYDYILKTYGVA